jgi:hypothetical protein
VICDQWLGSTTIYKPSALHPPTNQTWTSYQVETFFLKLMQTLMVVCFFCLRFFVLKICSCWPFIAFPTCRLLKLPKFLLLLFFYVVGILLMFDLIHDFEDVELSAFNSRGSFVVVAKVAQ